MIKMKANDLNSIREHVRKRLRCKRFRQMFIRVLGIEKYKEILNNG